MDGGRNSFFVRDIPLELVSRCDRIIIPSALIKINHLFQNCTLLDMSAFRGKHRIPDYRSWSHCQCWMCCDLDISRTLHELLDPGSSEFQHLLALHSFRWISRMLEIYCCLLVPLATLETYLNFSFLRFYMQIPVESPGHSVSEKKTERCDQVLRCIEKLSDLFFFYF